ncbi:MAG: LolA-related protein [Chromatiaceae bacterium]
MMSPERHMNMKEKVILALIFLGFSLYLPAAQLRVDELMGALANNTHGAATFTEMKYLSILDEPVESSGELLFVPPDRLEKHTLKPRIEALVLKGEVLTVEGPLQNHGLSLKDYPEVGGMIEGIRATLAGDRRALERLYRLGLEGGSDRWTLVLTPLDTRLVRLIDRIRMEGTGGELRKVEIWQADGDHSVMSIRKGTGS